MQEIIVETQGLCKRYKRVAALYHVNLKIAKGDIYGLVGQNGAGKTTFLRMITALSMPTSGTILLFGANGGSAYVSALKRVGAIIENAALFPNMTARENLEIQRLQKGNPDRRSIERVLEIVSLPDTGKKKVRDFSLGMRQRLGIAIALLSDPELLILDEPTNGLDPMGMVAMREMILRINQERGTTIIISSHILSELYQLATKYAFLHKGRVLEQISAENLNTKYGSYLGIRTDDAKRAVITLDRELAGVNMELMPDGLIKLYSHLEDVRKISTILTNGGNLLLHFAKAEDTLENYFLKLIEGAENA